MVVGADAPFVAYTPVARSQHCDIIFSFGNMSQRHGITRASIRCDADGRTRTGVKRTGG
jgi:hypothetical protein